MSALAGLFGRDVAWVADVLFHFFALLGGVLYFIVHAICVYFMFWLVGRVLVFHPELLTLRLSQNRICFFTSSHVLRASKKA